jgi:hypothetical protein
MSSNGELEQLLDDKPEFEKRVAETLHERHRWRWRSLSIWIVVFSLVVIVMYHTVRNLGEQNNERISDIQKSRIESCKANYEGIKRVAISLYPPRTVRSVQQAESLSKLNETIRKLKKKCAKQVRTP